MGVHRIELESANKGDPGAFSVKDLASQPIAAQATIRSTITGEAVPVPDGSLKEHLRKRAKELGGDEACVTFTIRYIPAPGEPPRPARPLPEGVRVIS